MAATEKRVKRWACRDADGTRVVFVQNDPPEKYQGRWHGPFVLADDRLVDSPVGKFFPPGIRRGQCKEIEITIKVKEK